jgi:Ser/Thr protein kinase RdoA (MazF antagonist)
MAAEPESPSFLADLLTAWPLDAGTSTGASAATAISRPEHGTNNRTFLVTANDRRFVLRISQNLSSAQVRAEQRLLARLRQGDLPFAVPEIAGADFGVQDPLVALSQSGALDGDRWQPFTAAFLRGYAAVRPLTPAEVRAFPELLLARALGSVLWRAGRWRRGQARLAEVTERIIQLQETRRWLDEHAAELVALAAGQLTAADECR